MSNHSDAGLGDTSPSTPLHQQQLVETISARVLELVDSGKATPIVVIDGWAGSGKSTLADLVQRQLFREGESLPRLIHMDDLYDGWHGLQAGSDYLLRQVLGPVVARRSASWQEYDWQAQQRGRWRIFDGGTPLIVEGCGSLSAASAELADLRVWLEVPVAIRHERWLARDGHQFDEQWPIWEAQEAEFYGRERSSERADLIGN